MESATIRQYLSQASTDAFGNDEIETESRYTFLIYIQLGIIKAAYPSVKKARGRVIELLTYLAATEMKDEENIQMSQDDYQDIKFVFANNKDTLLEIIEDIWDADTNNPELEWLEIWMANCRRILNESDFNQSFFDLSKLAYDHVGLSDKIFSVKLLLSSFIQLSKSFLNSSKIMRIE